MIDTLNPELCAVVCWTFRTYDPQFTSPDPRPSPFSNQIDASVSSSPSKCSEPWLHWARRSPSSLRMSAASTLIVD